MIFLLGGYDLEMLTIKKLLDEHNIEYYDKKLQWGAKLSTYKEYFNDHEEFYGVELEEDIEAPTKYTLIDHHGKYSHSKSSLEQVAELLNIKLSREMQLIAANDSRYIQGMQSLCATQEEIKRIRQQDRQAQGVTQEDEKLAKLSIQEANNSPFIYSKTEKFSAVSDRIYHKFSSYTIYNELTISFYGYRITQVITFLKSKNLKDDAIYYGGGDFGFVGIKKGTLSFEQIKNTIKEFKKMQQEKKKLYSYHTFMLPFKYDIKDKSQITKGWEKKTYSFGYNEKAYFHDFFIKSLTSVAYYTKEFEDITFIIKKSKEYKLELDTTSLRLFNELEIGILTINLKNFLHSDIKSILEINDFTRRLYPEYLYSENGEIKAGLVPEYVKFNGVKEDFLFNDTLKEPKISKMIEEFIPTRKITKAVDDRMFLLSFYENEKLANELKKEYLCHNRWYEYVFVDGSGKTVQNEAMQKKLIERATYARWQQYGTMYGMSKYSFVCLAASDFPLKHMQTMYQSMFTLLLTVRATLLKFSQEVSEVAKGLKNKDTPQKVNDLYERYIKFVNEFYFREVTAKDQGLEIYEQAVTTLNIERDVKDLDAEIEELHKYVEMQQKKEMEKEAEATNKKLNSISIYGGILLFASFVTGIFGMNVGEERNFSTLVVSLSIAVAIIIGWNLIKRKEHYE